MIVRHLLDKWCQIASNEDCQANAHELIVSQENVFVIGIGALEMSLNVIDPSSGIDRTDAREARADRFFSRTVYFAETMFVAVKSQIS